MNLVAGGAISTAANTAPSDEWVPEMPAGCYGTSEEQEQEQEEEAAAVVYLASDEARCTIGQQVT